MRPLFLALVPAGVALALLAYEVQVDSLHTADGRVVAELAAGVAFLVAGLLAWWRRPSNRLGTLMVAAGFALLLRQLRYAHDAMGFTLFFLGAELGFALVVHAALAYPSGRTRDPTERWLVRFVYAAALALSLAILLLHDVRDPLIQYGSLRRKSDILVAREAHAVELLQKSGAVLLFGAFTAAFVVLVCRRLVRAAPEARRLLLPLPLAALAVGAWGLYRCLVVFGVRSSALFWLQAAALLLVPVALLWGLLQAGIVRRSVGELVVDLERASPGGLRDALARGLGDPTLDLAFWIPERRAFADVDGRPFALPGDHTGRAVTRLAHDGEPLAVLVHDPALLEEPEVIEAAAAAARLALENARLGAELHAQLDKVKESRARIVAATDAERRRIERDIHDGAQQRLVALALGLRTAQRRLPPHEREVDAMLASAIDELQTAVTELRELARGVHPAILTEGGLGAALESLAIRAPIPVTLETAPGRRHSAEVEATAYFVACEGLANVVKHAHASAVVVGAHEERGQLVVEVADDGVGGAFPDGSGLSGLADRVEALGGRLSVDSPASAGTRLVARIPCGS
jgi:signal transduction histidine kinase